MIVVKLDSIRIELPDRAVAGIRFPNQSDEKVEPYGLFLNSSDTFLGIATKYTHPHHFKHIVNSLKFVRNNLKSGTYHRNLSWPVVVH